MLETILIVLSSVAGNEFGHNSCKTSGTSIAQPITTASVAQNPAALIHLESIQDWTGPSYQVAARMMSQQAYVLWIREWREQFSKPIHAQ